MDRKMPAVLVACLLSVLVVLCARAQAVPVPPYATTAHDTQLELTELAEEERDYARLLFYRLLSATLLTSVILLALFIRSKRHQVRLKIQKMQADLARRQAEAALSREQEARRRQELEAAQRKLEYYRSLNAITIPILCGRRNEQGALHLGDDDWEAVTRNTDACFDRFTERLRAHCPLRALLLPGQDGTAAGRAGRHLPHRQRQHLAPEDAAEGETGRGRRFF